MPTAMLSVDLNLLVLTVCLCFLQMLVSVLLALPQVGLSGLAGNREGLPPFSGMAGRAIRAHRNMVENLVLFAALVLVAAISGRANEMTALGAQIFFWARLVYAVVYLVGVPWLRTGVWAVSVAGLILIFLQLL